MASKDFSAAQHFYTRAGEMGLAKRRWRWPSATTRTSWGASGAIGMQADRDAARKWYEKARELGSPDAEAFLRRMGGR